MSNTAKRKRRPSPKDEMRYDLSHRYGVWGDVVESETRSILEDVPESKGLVKEYLLYMIDRLCEDTGIFGRLIAERTKGQEVQP